jgi:hypothetical protein
MTSQISGELEAKSVSSRLHGLNMLLKSLSWTASARSLVRAQYQMWTRPPLILFKPLVVLQPVSTRIHSQCMPLTINARAVWS